MRPYEIQTLINSLVKRNNGNFRTEKQANEIGNYLFNNNGIIGNWVVEFFVGGITKITKDNVVTFERK
jgi:hypothetical protein